jgi:hypothetical protein
MPITQILLTATTAAGGGPGGYPLPGSGTYISNTGGAPGGVQGTALNPGGGVESVGNSQNGWAYYIKDGQFNSDTTFFNGVAKTGADTYGGFGLQEIAPENYATQWVGYFPVPTTGDYNVHLIGDDLVYFWIGTAALEGNFNFSNYHHIVNNGNGYNTNSLALTGGLYYPVRMWFQEFGGAESAQVLIGPAASNAVAMNQYTIVNNSQTEGHNPASPTYTITPVADNVDEGSELAFTVGGTNITNGTYYWTVDGNGPFDGENGSFEIANNLGSITVTPTADTTTEGSETFTLSIRSDSISGTVLQTSESITINDTSLTPEPTYTITPAADNVDEGSSLEFTIGGTNITNGTYYWNTDTGDLVGFAGEVIITDNSGSFSVTPTADNTTEGSETFTATLRSGSVEGTILATSTAVTINDTSLTPEPTYTLTPAADNIDEGSSLTITVGGTNITNGTYYWTVETGAGDFTTNTGEVSVTDNSGSFTVTPTEDSTTEGLETFTVALRSGSVSGSILQTSESITINDTSLAPPFSLEFNQPQQDFLRVDASSSFNLGNNWTMEFWISANNGSLSSPRIPGGQWGLINQGGWYGGMPNDNCILVGLAGGNLTINQSANDAIEFAEPTPNGVPSGVTLVTASTGNWESNPVTDLATTAGTGTGLRVNVSHTGGYASTITIATAGSGYTNGETIVVDSGTSSAQFTISVNSQVVWTHVAIVNNGGGSAQKVYYNGVEQAKVSGSYTSNGKTNTSDDIYIGRLAPNNSSHFDGKMALIRISNTAKYLTAFTPSTTYNVEADTVLLLDSDTPLIGQSYFELNGIVASQTNGGTIYFAKATYPDLNNQVQAGDTVVDADTSDSSTVTAAVYTADPDNWGINVSSFQNAGTKNFSGPRSAPVTNNGTTESVSFPATYTVRQWLGSYSGGNNTDIYVLIADYPDAATIPAGATAVINGTVVALENNALGTYSGQAVRQLGFFPQIAITAGTTITFTWTT